MFGKPRLDKLLQLSEDDRKRKIYRVFEPERLFLLLESKQLSFSHPSTWSDKYENIFLNQPLNLGSLKVEMAFKDQFYGQCWSFCIESDAMWRLYGKDGYGVKISTSIPKLFRILQEQHHFSYVGKVHYFTKANLKKEIDAFVRNGEMNFVDDSQSIGQAKTLLYKLAAYKYEQEVRAIVFDVQSKFLGHTRLSVDVDPNELIEQIIFGGPSLDKKTFESLKNKAQALGYTGKIIRSSLYDMPKFS